MWRCLLQPYLDAKSAVQPHEKRMWSKNDNVESHFLLATRHQPQYPGTTQNLGIYKSSQSALLVGKVNKPFTHLVDCTTVQTIDRPVHRINWYKGHLARLNVEHVWNGRILEFRRQVSNEAGMKTNKEKILCWEMMWRESKRLMLGDPRGRLHYRKVHVVCHTLFGKVRVHLSVPIVKCTCTMSPMYLFGKLWYLGNFMLPALGSCTQVIARMLEVTLRETWCNMYVYLPGTYLGTSQSRWELSLHLT